MDRFQRIREFTETIWAWYACNRRSLPWRDLDALGPEERAYRVLVSEIMLQQTQVSRCIPAYRCFLRTFPHLADVAAASNRAVILAWRGMGYNARALRLRDAARVIVQVYGGRFPRGEQALQALPGIGAYTAAAIRNFAWNMPTPCVDTNIRRVLHRTFVGPERQDGTWEKDDRWLRKLAAAVLETALDPALHRSSHAQQTAYPRTAAEWHAALMDFGSLVQTKRNPRWDICPLTERGIMKTTEAGFARRMQSGSTSVSGWDSARRREPGRFVGTRYVPNRIVRGRIVEELRNHPRGLTLAEMGRRVCVDWHGEDHTAWLRDLAEKLVADALLARKGKVYMLRD